MQCAKCKNALAEDAKFCNECGAEVKEQFSYCKQCNHELKKDDKFCEKCGERVHNKEHVEEIGKDQEGKSPTVSAGRKKNKGIIATIVGVVGLVVIVFLVFNMKDNNEDSIKDYSLEGLAEHYGIEEDLLTYEEMSDVVTKIESEYEEDLKELSDKDRSLFIEEIIEEDHGNLNAKTYREGLLIKDGMSDSDKQQVIAELVSEGIAYKYIRNPINGAYQMTEDNRGTTLYDLLGKSSRFSYNEDDEIELILIADTEGYIDINGIKLGYPTIELVNEGQVYGNGEENTLVYVSFTSLLKEDLTTEEYGGIVFNSLETKVNGEKAINYNPYGEEELEEMKEYIEEEIKYEEEEGEYAIHAKNTFAPLFGVYLPLEDVVEGYTETGESIEDVEEKLENGKYGNPKIDVEGIEMEFIIPEEDIVVNPEIIETVGSK